MLKQYEIRDALTGRICTVQADTFQSACERAGILPCNGILLGYPKKQVYLMEEIHDGHPVAIVVASSEEEAIRIAKAKTHHRVEVRKVYPELIDAYYDMVMWLARCGPCLGAWTWLNLLAQICMEMET